MANSHDPMYPEESEWGEWHQEDPKDSWETRKHAELIMYERRCRHCKFPLGGIPVQDCEQEDCKAANFLGGYEPTSLRKIAFELQDSLQAMAELERQHAKERVRTKRKMRKERGA